MSLPIFLTAFLNARSSQLLTDRHLEFQTFFQHSLSPFQKYLKKATPAKIAVTLSHLKTLNLLIERNLEQAIIFEDDVKVPLDFRCKLGFVLNEVPGDYDYVYLWTHPKHMHRDDAMFLITGKSHIRHYSYTYTNTAYLVTLAGAKRIVKYISRSLHDYTDFMINDMHSTGKLTTYMSRTNLVENLGQSTSIANAETLKSNIHPPQSVQSKMKHSFRRAVRRNFKVLVEAADSNRKWFK